MHATARNPAGCMAFPFSGLDDPALLGIQTDDRNGLYLRDTSKYASHSSRLWLRRFTMGECTAGCPALVVAPNLAGGEYDGHRP